MSRLLSGLLVLLLSVTVAQAQPTGTRPHASNQYMNKLRVKSWVPCAASFFVSGFNASTGVPVCLQPSSTMLSDVSSLLTTTSVHRVTNKQLVPRVCTPTVTANAITPDADACDVQLIPSLAA